MIRVVATLIACSVLVLHSGCSGKPSNRVDLWGKVTFKGQPVPAGQIIINPDFSKGNDGVQGIAEIHDGQFDTRTLDKGAPSGAVILMISGFESATETGAPSGKPLFVDYKLSTDVPKEPTEKNIEVPGSAAKANAAPVQLP